MAQDQTDNAPISLDTYREFRLELEAKLLAGEVFAVDVEQIKHEFCGVSGTPAFGAEQADPNARRQRAHRLRRARIAVALGRELESRVS